MAIREEIRFRPGSEIFIAYVDDAGKETKLPLPTNRDVFTATMRLLRAAGRRAVVVREWDGDERSRIGVDFDEEMKPVGCWR